MLHDDKSIYVTSPALAPIAEYSKLLEEVWGSGILTHNGPLVQRLENEMKDYLRVLNFTLVTSGTVALQMAIKALELKGEIITTPFTWIATTAAIQWENCVPRFVDVNPETLNINPNLVEDAITNNTSAILGVHVFSNPCQIEDIDQIAKANNLKVIYDAAHAMCVNFQGRSIMEYGDISATSFHATKLFNTAEGGACITVNNELADRLKRLRFFGYDNNKQIVDIGFNGKMTEIHAALGLVNLKYLDDVLNDRKRIFDTYFNQLKDLEFIRWQKFDINSYNYSYLPLIFDSEERMLRIKSKLNEKNIFPRRYFFPSLNTLSIVNNTRSLPQSEKLAKTILCLPSYYKLLEDDISEICEIIKR